MKKLSDVYLDLNEVSKKEIESFNKLKHCCHVYRSDNRVSLKTNSNTGLLDVNFYLYNFKTQKFNLVPSCSNFKDYLIPKKGKNQIFMLVSLNCVPSLDRTNMKLLEDKAVFFDFEVNLDRSDNWRDCIDKNIRGREMGGDYWLNTRVREIEEYYEKFFKKI